MIPFASQRANSEDLAVHLMNERDNDEVELMDIRGAVSNDLSGAFAEWDFQRKAYTNCDKFLYSLSVNCDPKQPALSHEQYMEYLGDVEQELGLEGQGRAVVRHIKNGREHYHAVYSRIDSENKRAIPISFDKMKLMRVTRDFALRHEIELPKGYANKDDRAQSSQLSLYDKVQEQETGISKTERSEFITGCWKRRDTPASFVAELQENGYILASGRRPYVLVDQFGHINSLARLINDPDVRIKHVREFLGTEYPEESLPDADTVKEQLKNKKASSGSEEQDDRRDKKEKLSALKLSQIERRKRLETEKRGLRKNQQRERDRTVHLHRTKMVQLRSAYGEEKARAHQPRSEGRLKTILATVSGYKAITKAIRRYKDRQRMKKFLDQKAHLRVELEEQQAHEKRIHELQLMEFRRKEKALDGVEKREAKSLDTALEHRRIHRLRQGQEHMPALALTLSPPGRKANVHRARHRHTHSTKTYQSREEHEGLSEYFNEKANPYADQSDSESPTFEHTERGKPRKR